MNVSSQKKWARKHQNDNFKRMKGNKKPVNPEIISSKMSSEIEGEMQTLAEK